MQKIFKFSGQVLSERDALIITSLNYFDSIITLLAKPLFKRLVAVFYGFLQLVKRATHPISRKAFLDTEKIQYIFMIDRSKFNLVDLWFFRIEKDIAYLLIGHLCKQALDFFNIFQPAIFLN